MGGTLDTNDILPFDAKWSEFKEKLDFCINPLFDLRIFSNGGVSFCCSGDPDNSDEFNLGNIKESSLLSLYNSKKSILLQKNESSRCKKCNYYHPFSEHKDNIGHFFENPLDFIGA
jgi:radical SAM protein with 4Fe4S-binding SPASM domain